ncbi:hypothetical protein [Candidatus Anaplasma sp. TIGMIC]|uniref:hypothetical protein n=1 Tax=Candidatus Anaplasma sp. TIGMIC TaxID=3020713 RepID=UPI002330C432|nr:hypothetical protein [Candidatus Anaplasma sp. TIGMIC]MDB1135270.1 hypothetical protein [Candidatus Anaplasma sp. TIGMIC]
MQGHSGIDIALLYVWVYAILSFMHLIISMGLLILEPSIMATDPQTDLRDSEDRHVGNTTRSTNDAEKNSCLLRQHTEERTQLDCSGVQCAAQVSRTR